MSLEVQYRPLPQLAIKLEVKDLKELFQELGPLQEIFASMKCGKCSSENIRFIHREQDKHDFYELQCIGCNAKLSIGQNLDGDLFPRRYEQDPDDKKKPLMKDGKKVYLPNGGWMKWDAKNEKYV